MEVDYGGEWEIGNTNEGKVTYLMPKMLVGF